jgi:hypothetical protein
MCVCEAWRTSSALTCGGLICIDYWQNIDSFHRQYSLFCAPWSLWISIIFPRNWTKCGRCEFHLYVWLEGIELVIERRVFNQLDFCMSNCGLSGYLLQIGLWRGFCTGSKNLPFYWHVFTFCSQEQCMHSNSPNISFQFFFTGLLLLIALLITSHIEDCKFLLLILY